MTRRATVYEQAQLGVEATEAQGTGVAAEHLIHGLSIGDPAPQGSFGPFRPDGSKYSTAVRRSKEFLTLPYTAAGCYNALAYILDSLLGIPAATPIAVSLQDNAYERVYVPSTGPDTCQTYTIEKGSSVRAWKSVWSLFNSLQFQVQANSEDLTFSGNILSKYFTDDIAMTASPVEVDYVPIQPDHWAVYIASTHAGLDTADPLATVLSVSFAHGEKFGAAFAVNRNNFWRGVSEKAPELSGEITMEAGSTEMGWTDTYARGLTPLWLRLQAEGEEINDDADFTFQIDMKVYLSALPALADAEGIYGVTYQYTLVNDATLGAPFDIHLINTVGELAPPA